MEILTALLGGLLLLLIVLFYSLFVWGFVLSKFWVWFLLPVFPNLPQITYMQAVGLVFVISLFGRGSFFIKDEYKDKNAMYIYAFVNPWLTLLLGYIVYSWFM